jgi:hypothetical protein
MGSQLPAGGQGGLTPEALAAMQQLGITPQGGQAPPLPQVITPPAPAAAQPGFLSQLASMLGNYFMKGTDAATLAGAVPQAPVKTPEQQAAELAARNQALSGGKPGY